MPSGRRDDICRQLALRAHGPSGFGIAARVAGVGLATLWLLAMGGAAAASQAEPTAAPVRLGRVSLLPEGVVLEKAVGEASIDEATAMVVFSPQVSNRDLARRLYLLPGGVRGDLAAAIEAGAARGEGAIPCEITGRVLTYRGRNYLLPTAVSALSPKESPATAAPAAVPRESVPARLGEEDLASQLERELEARVGEAARALDLGSDGAAVEASTERRWHRRRGHFRRDLASGMLVFVPEADGTGARDHPLEVLPCRQLESIERAVSAPAGGRVMRVSGLVISEGERRFLLPTAFEVPREGRGIAP
jgi:hypothetical protein